MICGVPVSGCHNFGFDANEEFDVVIEYGDDLVAFLDGEGASWKKIKLYVGDYEDIFATQV